MKSTGINIRALFNDWLRREPLALRWIPVPWKWLPLLMMSVAMPAMWIVPSMSDAMSWAMQNAGKNFNTTRMESALLMIVVSGSLCMGGLTQWLNRGRPAWTGVLSGVGGSSLFSFHTAFLPLQVGFWVMALILGMAAAIASSVAVHRIRHPAPVEPLRVSAVWHLLLLLASLIFYQWAVD